MMNQMLPQVSLSNILKSAPKKREEKKQVTELKGDPFKSYSTLIQFLPETSKEPLNRFLKEPHLAPDGV